MRDGSVGRDDACRYAAPLLVSATGTSMGGWINKYPSITNYYLIYICMSTIYHCCLAFFIC